MIVSSKGQIVIPKKYRDRLGIDPGMEVVVRIRGQYLIVEIDHDVQADVEFLASLSGQLGEQEIEMPMIEDILNDLIKQQFYHGDDILTDRINQTTLKIRGSGVIIEQTVKIMAQASRNWLKGDYVECLRQFADALDIDFLALLAAYVRTLKNMLPGGDLSMIQMMGGEIPYTMAVSTCLTHFREKVGDVVTESLIKLAEERGYVDDMGEEAVEDMITQSLAEKYSILMNLRTLREMARTSVKFVGARQFNLLSDEMLNGFADHGKSESEKRQAVRKERRDRRKGKGKPKDPSSPDISEELDIPAIPDMDIFDQKGEEPKEDNEMPDLPEFDF